MGGAGWWVLRGRKGDRNNAFTLSCGLDLILDGGLLARVTRVVAEVRAGILAVVVMVFAIFVTPTNIRPSRRKR